MCGGRLAMPRENAAAKARRLLIEGRVNIIRRVGPELLAEIRGDSGEVYQAGHEPGRWWCSCPAVDTCSHVRALMLVAVVVRPAVTPDRSAQSA